MNEIRNHLFCTIDNLNKCVRINQIADCGSEQCERITMITVVFPNDNIRRASEQLNLDEPLPLDVGKDRLKQEVSKRMIAYYGNEYQWMKDDCFDIIPDAEMWHVGRRLSCLILMLFASHAAFALTETVDGIEWSYYEKNGYAVLEHPDTRNNSSKPKPAHKGVLPQSLELPSTLGGMSVREIGIAAIQLDASTDVKTLIIPESVTTVSSCAFLGAYTKTENTLWYTTYFHYEPIGVQNIFFKGDRPDLWASNSWELKFDYEYRCLIRGNTSLKVWCVEGCDGWAENNHYSYTAGGINVLYGAAKVDMFPVDGICQAGAISLSCTNTSAVLRYTIDGGEPVTNDTTNCFVYDGSITINRRTTIKVIACVNGYPYAVTYTKEFALGKVQIPNITASQHVFHWSGNTVTLVTENEAAVIHYTLDGSEPTEKSKLYTGPFTIDDTTTIKAKAFKTDWFESETATATFTREWYTVDAPVIEPSGAEFENVSQTVSLSCPTDGATIFYTTDGSDPKVNGREYTKPFTIYKSCTVRAIAIKYDWKDSTETTAIFTRGESLSEAANFYGYTMETDTAAPWTVDAAVSHDGVSSVRSGAIGNNGTTYLMASVKKAGTVSFWWKARCEEPDEEDGEDGYYDYGAFLVDDAVKARIAGNDTGWRFVSVEVPTGGKHVLQWKYNKDGATSYAPDCIWVDQVQWVPADGSGYTLTTPEPVPYAWLDQYNLVVGTDYETVGNAASGKSQGGNATKIWEEYVAGTDPTNKNSRLEAQITMKDGNPVITWEPDLNTGGGNVRIYKVYGSETLNNGGDWQYPTNSLHRFFKVDVEMP